MKRASCFAIVASAIVVFAPFPAVATTTFDFDNLFAGSNLPLNVTVDGLTAYLSVRNYGSATGFSIQSASTQPVPIPAFSGNDIYPNSIYPSDLLVSFFQALTDFSIMYAPQELATDSSATMRVTAYMGTTLVGTNTFTNPKPGTWPVGTLSFSSALLFDNVVVHYDKPPVTGGDWGPIFIADNMIVTVAPPAVPLPAALPLFATGLGALGLLGWRRKKKAAALAI